MCWFSEIWGFFIIICYSVVFVLFKHFLNWLPITISWIRKTSNKVTVNLSNVLFYSILHGNMLILNMRPTLVHIIVFRAVASPSLSQGQAPGKLPAEMHGVAICAASQVKGAGSGGKGERPNRITKITAEETNYKWKTSHLMFMPLGKIWQDPILK